MADINYLDFDLQIEGSEAGYRARVLNSPAGQASVDFRLPLSELEIENLILRLGRTRRGVRRLDSPEMETAKSFGGRLFEAVFDDEVRGCLRSSLEEVRRQDGGLRIRLHLADVPQLTDLPWEYLYDTVFNRFLVLSVETPIVRYLDLPERIRPLKVEPPIRVLVMISSPSDYPQLDTDQEWERLSEALGDLERQGRVVLERQEAATLATLQKLLRLGKYQIFHFIGHGRFDPQAQDGVLLLEDEEGRGLPVSGQKLATFLHDHRDLRLAILNACEGARSSRSDPFAGTAQSLVQQGIPAVIAMQFEVTDEAAIRFAHEFYAAVANGYPVDAALTAGRKAIYAQGNDVEWGTPVLFLRAPDGRIFDLPPAKPPEEPPLEPPPPEDPEDMVLRLEGLYTKGLSASFLEEWTKAVRNFQTIVDIRPDYQDATAKLKEAKRQAELDALYSEAQAALQAEDWPAAISKLEMLLAEAPEFKDAAAKLEFAKRNLQLTKLYADAQRLYQAHEWEAVVRAFAKIAAIEPEYPDSEGLLAEAERQDAIQKRRLELESHYGQALRSVDEGRWKEAHELLLGLQETEPGFRDTVRLLEGISKSLADQVAQAIKHLQAERWQDAITGFQAVVDVDPEYVDATHGSLELLLARAQEEKERASLPEPPKPKKPPQPTTLAEEAKRRKPARSKKTRPHDKPRDLPQ